MNKQAFLDTYLVDRRNTDCQKWDDLQRKFGQTDLLAMWVADMEFKTCDSITEALMSRVQHGVFGYSRTPDAYWEAYSNWMKTRYNVDTDRTHVRFANGCVTAIAYIINAFTKPGDACFILTPVYYPFHNTVKATGRRLVTVDLDNDHGFFSMNYEAIERSIVENGVKLFLMCSPHNPAGRVWTEEELDTVMSICRKHGVLVCSDEIHQDFTFNGCRFFPACNVAGGAYRDMLITLNSASKTFNLASLIHSHIIISNDELRKRYDEYALSVNKTTLSLMGMTAAMAGYAGGAEWLDALKEVIWDNYQYLKSEFARRLPKAVVCGMDGTYLPMIDLRAYVDPDNMVDFVQKKCRLGVDYGEWFGENFKGFIRFNMATDPAFVKEAARRIADALGQ